MKASLVQHNSHNKRYTHKPFFVDFKNNSKNAFKPKMTNPSFKRKKGNFCVYGKLGHYAYQCKKKDEK